MKIYNKKREEEVWYALYGNFNDENLSHADNAFVSNGYQEATAKELHEVNKAFVSDLLNSVSYDEIKEVMPVPIENYL